MSTVGRYREQLGSAQTTHVGQRWLHQNGTQLQTATYQVNSNFVTDPRVKVKRCWDELHPGPPYKDGGRLYMIRSENPFFHVQGHVNHTKKSGSLEYKYVGGFTPSSFASSQIPSSDLGGAGESGPYTEGGGFGDPSALGPTVYNRMRPRMSALDLGVFLGESREIPRMLKQTAFGFHKIWKRLGGHSEVLTPKAVANEWLNTQFGWKPFLSDLHKIINLQETVTKKIHNLRCRNGEWVKRKGTYSNTTGITNHVRWVNDNAPKVYPALPSAHLRFPYPGQGSKWGMTDTYTEETQKIWYEGHFRYWIPALEKDNDPYFHKVNVIRSLGLNISPSLVWNLTPWSWMADWFTNAGDVVDNITSRGTDNVASKHCYLMEHRYKRAVNSSVIHLWNEDVCCEWSQQVETKSRHAASSFGFDLAPGDFTPRQLSILAALGMSRH